MLTQTAFIDNKMQPIWMSRHAFSLPVPKFSRALTFTIANGYFRIYTGNILSFSDEYKQIPLASYTLHQCVLSYVDCRDAFIDIYNNAVLLNRKRNWDIKTELYLIIEKFLLLSEWIIKAIRKISALRIVFLKHSPHHNFYKTQTRIV
jgi:hypothetical protein